MPVQDSIRVIVNRRFKRQYVKQLLSERSCTQCGESDSRLLRFVHAENSPPVATLAAEGIAWKKLNDLIEKSDVLCLNHAAVADELREELEQKQAELRDRKQFEAEAIRRIRKEYDLPDLNQELEDA